MVQRFAATFFDRTAFMELRIAISWSYLVRISVVLLLKTKRKQHGQPVHWLNSSKSKAYTLDMKWYELQELFEGILDCVELMLVPFRVER